MRSRIPIAVSVLVALVACGGAGTIYSAMPSEQPTAPPQQSISNASGPCLVIRGENGRVIENMKIGPCGGNGIEVWDSQNVTLRNVTIADTSGSGVYIVGSTSVQVNESKISNTISGVYAVDAKNIGVRCNTIEDPRGPIPRGQLVQFDKVSGDANEISCNRGLNTPGKGQPEDAISLYKSTGVAGKPITVQYNLLIGGGPSNSGGGIMLGDDGGAYLLAKGNVLVDPGQYGIGVASGEHNAILDNTIYARRQAFTNVGIYVWNQYPSRCNGVTVSGNSVNWRNKSGAANPFWNGDNCGAVSVTDNNFAARINETIAARRPPAQCTCQSQGWR